MTDEFQIRQLLVQYPSERRCLEELLLRHGLRPEEPLDIAFGIFDSEEVLRGCGCASGGLLKCFAVDDALRGQNALGSLVSALMQNRFEVGIYDLFVITRAHNEPLFAGCGWYTVVRTDELVMLENRPHGPETFAKRIRRPEDSGKQVGAIVMNANPFTKGHLSLVERAAARCELLHLFVVEEDRSLFPTAVRLGLVQAGTAHLPNVRVHLSGHYMISAATFPTYFLKDDEDAATLQAELDIALFGRRIAPLLGISCRFAGEEPLDITTACYNRTMARLLPGFGVEFCELPRLASGGKAISASRVRRLLEEKGVCDELLALVSDTTADYLKQHAKEILK